MTWARTLLLLLLLGWTLAARAQDRLLEEAVDLTGAVLYHSSGAPGVIVGAVRNGKTAVAGFGRARSDGSTEAPDGETLMRIGSITKVFAGTVLAGLVADGTVRLTDPLDKHLPWRLALPSRDGRRIRLVDLATHTSGLPREIEREAGPADDPMRTLTQEAFERNLRQKPLLFAPGTGALYSNFAFDVLAAALSSAAKRPYADLLQERVVAPAKLVATSFRPVDAHRSNLMQGHGFDGKPMPDIPTSPMAVGSGGLYSTTNDILRWLAWHMEEADDGLAEVRMLGHLPYVPRSSVSPVAGLDESGHMDAIGLGWIIMRAQDGRPQILQKAGGLQGVFTYAAFAPSRRIGVFAAINQFNFSSAMAMARLVNDLIGELAPQ